VSLHSQAFTVGTSFFPADRRIAHDAIARMPARAQATEETGDREGINDGGFSPESRAWKQAVR